MATFIPDTSNTLFQLAADLINQSNRNIFLTGKAGTGKTTFLKYIRENCPKQMAILAPTGVAAINAGGVTIHSFFQLPFSPFIPATRGTGFKQDSEATVNSHNLISRLRFNSDKRKLLQQLELLVIDEISMVRCDMLDAVDLVLRYFRKRPYEKFGGVQLLFIGDMFQLPPVIKEAEWNLLTGYYDSPYFFSSLVLKEEPPLYIEFDKIYRQSEEKFIRVLNQVRNNNMDEDSLKILESRYQPNATGNNSEGNIILTTHNEQAKNINHAALNKINEQGLQYPAEIADDFPANAFPADELLHLKTGAQVMFIKNDVAEKGKRYFNGKIGVVSKLIQDKVFVQCADEPYEIEVTKEKWDNIRYTVDKATQQVKETVLGSFTQFPLRLAWAITIHKSQGLTFEKAIIDAGEAFAPGQVYVALSRCTSLEGLILKSKIRPGSLFTDSRIVEFSQNISSSSTLNAELENARRHYQEQLLLSTFDFKLSINYCDELRQYLLKNEDSFNNEILPWLDSLTEKITAMQDTAVKFHPWIKSQFADSTPPEKNIALQERIKKAAAHFINEISAAIAALQQSIAVTDSRQHAKEYNDSLKEVFTLLCATKYQLQGFDAGFNTATWHSRKNSFVLPPFTVNAYGNASQKQQSSPHPLLHKQLRELRDAISNKKDIPIYRVIRTKTIDDLCTFLPNTLGELKRIKGFGNVKLEQYGQQFLSIINEYCHTHGLECTLPPQGLKEKPVKENKLNSNGSYVATYTLFKEGKSITEIAKERNLAISTVEGHLALCVGYGIAKVNELLDDEKLSMINEHLKDFDGKSITPIKAKLGDKASWGEIRMAIAAFKIQ